MIYTCYSELCEILEDCECGSDCCSGEIRKPLIITMLSDIQIVTNNPQIEYNVSYEDIEDLAIQHLCPFCNNYVEL